MTTDEGGTVQRYFPSQGYYRLDPDELPGRGFVTEADYVRDIAAARADRDRQWVDALIVLLGKHGGDVDIEYGVNKVWERKWTGDHFFAVALGTDEVLGDE